MRKASSKQWEKLNKTKQGKLRIAARRVVGVLRRSHGLNPSPCVICGSQRVNAHHVDYTKPLLVAWLCTQHHADADRGKLEITESMLVTLKDTRDPKRIAAARKARAAIAAATQEAR